MEKRFRSGIGYDVHRFSPNRKLILGGCEIPCDVGLLGHSDADVLSHAIADALLGAAGLGDIGIHFPDSDDQWKGVSSIVLLEKIAEMLKFKNIQIEWVDSIVIAQKPKIMPFAEKMQDNLARALGVSDNCINIKATTTEKLGFEGREEGIASQAIATVSLRG